MELYSKNENYKLYQGSMLDMLNVIEKETIDCIITDPPYELNFMGKGWDNAGVSFNKETWQRCFEVLKEGGYLLAFGGTRTYHRIACAIEDAGFEIRDCIMWLYGSGFPKSMNIGLAIDKKNGVESKVIGERSGAKNNADNSNASSFIKGKVGYKANFIQKQAQNEWQGWGTCLKPAYEPIIIARKPFKGSLVDNVIENGVGGLNIDECRVATNDKLSIHSTSKTTEENDMYNWSKERETFTKPEQELGRFPANIIHDGSEEVCDGFPNTKGSANVRHNKNTDRVGFITNNDTNFISTGFNDSGSASRYFYCAKASKKDRDEGLEKFEDKEYILGCNGATLDNIRGKGHYGNGGNGLSTIKIRKNTHPTVKPTELMQYLVRLVAPKGATILDPFNGSGSTGKAVMYENKERKANYNYIGIELTAEYLPIAKARIEYVINLEDKEQEFEQITF